MILAATAKQRLFCGQMTLASFEQKARQSQALACRPQAGSLEQGDVSAVQTLLGHSRYIIELATL